MLTVQDDYVVSLDYVLRLTDGQEVDSSGSEPLNFIQGHGQIIPGLERALYGLSLGEQKHVVVEPGDAYGEYDPQLLENLPRNLFPTDMVLEKGMGFRMRTEDGQVIVAYVDTIEGEEVKVDMNHPMAGKTLHFDVKVAGLREATEDELSHAGGCGCEECGSGCEGGCEGGCEEGCSCGDDDESDTDQA